METGTDGWQDEDKQWTFSGQPSVANQGKNNSILVI
jgi:hypothetical protein